MQEKLKKCHSDVTLGPVSTYLYVHKRVIFYQLNAWATFKPLKIIRGI